MTFQHHEHRASERIRVELIEADVDMAFGLVDDALDAYHSGDREFAESALRNAEIVLNDIQDRLARLEPERRTPFGPLVDELRKAIRAAQTECA